MKAIEKQIAKHNKENENKIIGYTNGAKILSSGYFYGHQTKVTDKEVKYRELIEKYQLPYIICIDSMEDTFVNERDVYDAFLGNYKESIFFKNEYFSRNVTGLLFRYFLRGGFTYYHNEFAANKLNDSNYEIFKYFQYAI